jgi:hypothetical protein
MTSRRPPRRDPRAEDEQAPPTDHIGARRPPRAPGSGLPPERSTSSPGLDEHELDTLRSRYAEAESKRRRAEALADGLTHRITQLETELRSRGSSARVQELEDRLTETESALVSAQAKLVMTEAALTASDAVVRRLQGAEAVRSSPDGELAERQLAESERQLAESERQLAESERQLAESRREIATSKEELAEAQAQLAGAREQLAQAQAQLASSRAVFDDQLAESQHRLSAARAEITKLEAEADAQRARADELEAGQRRVKSAAVSSARDVLARLARHEEKLAGLRKEALSRAVALLEEAGAVHGANDEQARRMTPSVPLARPTTGAQRRRTTAPPAARRTTSPPSAKRTAPSNARLPSAATPPKASFEDASRDAPTPVQGTKRSAPGVRRTVQGLAAIPILVPGPKPEPTPPSPAPEEAELTIDAEAADGPAIEIEVED